MSEPKLILVTRKDDGLRDDIVLANAAADGDQEALEGLLSRIFNRVQRTTSFLARNRADAEDFLQLALMEVTRSIGSFRGDCPLEYWVDRIAVRTASEQIAKRKRRERLFELFDKGAGHPPAQADDLTDRSRARQRLARILQGISVKNRTVLVLHYLWGHNIEEMADILECPENTVRGRVRQGRKQLKKAILDDPVLSSWIDWRKQ